MKTTWLKYTWQAILAGVAVFIFYLAMRALYRLTQSVDLQEILLVATRYSHLAPCHCTARGSIWLCAVNLV